ncbi:MAG: helix-turn-helix transcriptional regulator [Gammaproteobacteria bacterium]|nr:helix-turn-helix transcriptional regulator [Pseudomonadales bacterium]MCP5347901.1 helix-turn-helix transcriptional regulator [Pseudomonadales bacterium]
MENLNALLAGLAISQLLFLGCYIVFNVPGHRMARILVLFSLCLSGFLAGGIPVLSSHPAVDLVLDSLAILTPAMLWLFAMSFFKDERHIPPYGAFLIGVYFLLRTGDSLLELQGYTTGAWGYYLGYLLPTVIMFGLSLHVVYMGIEGRRADLLEQRRRLRLPFVISMGVVVIFTLSFGVLSPLIQRMLSPQGSQLFVAGVTLVIYSAVFLWTLGLNLATFQILPVTERLLQNPQRISPARPEKTNGARTVLPDSRLMEKINGAMNEQKLYKERGFTIAQLGNKLSTSEQRLRTTINQTMEFRNFNQFLNHYRIREAAQLLKDSDESIANIAMDVGYNSLSAFNKAFKETYGRTPRDYRAGD